MIVPLLQTAQPAELSIHACMPKSTANLLPTTLPANFLPTNQANQPTNQTNQPTKLQLLPLCASSEYLPTHSRNKIQVAHQPNAPCNIPSQSTHLSNGRNSSIGSRNDSHAYCLVCTFRAAASRPGVHHSAQKLFFFFFFNVVIVIIVQG